MISIQTDKLSPLFESARLGPDDQLLDPKQSAQLGTEDRSAAATAGPAAT